MKRFEKATHSSGTLWSERWLSRLNSSDKIAFHAHDCLTYGVALNLLSLDTSEIK